MVFSKKLPYFYPEFALYKPTFLSVLQDLENHSLCFHLLSYP